MRILRIFFQWLGVLLLGAVAALGVYTVRSLEALQSTITGLKDELASTKALFDQFSTETRDQMAAADQRLTALSDLLYTEQKRIDDIADNVQGVDRRIGRLSGSVETLEKLTTTDPELLQKYSKVYFLNEHYMPADLTVIDEKYDTVNGKQVSVHAQVWPFLEDLLEAAWDDGIELMVLSGYRSFTEQGTLKQNYTQKYGTGANTFSADQGYSEHQLGTTVDFTDTTIGENINAFADTEAYGWLKDNAYKYGFVMSYPENNAFYIYEPWHWRFVGKELADYMHEKGLQFYDMEQRKIDEYIPTLFDK